MWTLYVGLKTSPKQPAQVFSVDSGEEGVVEVSGVLGRPQASPELILSSTVFEVCDFFGSVAMMTRVWLLSLLLPSIY